MYIARIKLQEMHGQIKCTQLIKVLEKVYSPEEQAA